MALETPEVALLTVFQKIRFDEEFERQTTRFRISAKTLRLISGRARLPDSFVTEWFNELFKLGYIAFPFEGYYGIVEVRVVEGWVRIGSARISKEIEALDSKSKTRTKRQILTRVQEQQKSIQMRSAKRIRKSDK